MKKIIKAHISEFNLRQRTPIFTHCRKLVADGVDPATWLEVYRNHDTPDFRIQIGKGAKLTVKEEPFPHFAKFKPFKGIAARRKAVSDRYMSAQDRVFSKASAEVAEVWANA